MLTVACVLRSGGEYEPWHVWALQDGVRSHLPVPHRFVCLTDTEVNGVTTVPLHYDWPGWWSKMELFRPGAVHGDLLFLDLDTILVGDLTDIAGADRLTLLRDYYRSRGLQSSVMYVPAGHRPAVWDAWMQDPEGHMAEYRSDQEFLETLWLRLAARWQDTHPGQFVSYKANDVAENGVPDGVRVIVYHGQPRPWDTDLWAA